MSKITLSSLDPTFVSKLKDQLKAFVAKFDAAAPVVPAPAAPAPGAPAPATSYTANVPGGQPMYVDISDDGIADVDQGDAVFSDATMATPYPDGTYTLDDGTSVTVSGGMVASVTPSDPDMNAASGFKSQFAAHKIAFEKAINTKFKAAEDRIKALEKQISDQKQGLADLNEISKTSVEFMDKLVNTPVEEKKKRAEIPANFSELTGLEKYKLKKQLENE